MPELSPDPVSLQSATKPRCASEKQAAACGSDWCGIAMSMAAIIASLQTCPTCGARPCVNPSFCAACRADDQRVHHQRPQIERRPTPRSTIEAIMYCVRERGTSALREPANLELLRTCDDAALAEIDRRLARLEGSST